MTSKIWRELKHMPGTVCKMRGDKWSYSDRRSSQGKCYKHNQYHTSVSQRGTI